MSEDLSVDLAPPSMGPIGEAKPVGASLADKLAAAQIRRKPPVVIALNADPSIAVRFKTVIPMVLRERFAKLIQKERDNDANVGLLIAQCDAILINGEVVVDDLGKPVTFNDPGFMRDLGATNPQEALARFYGGADGMDAAVVEIYSVANAIYRAGVGGPAKDEKGVPLD